MKAEIVRGDPGVRRRAVALLIGAAVSGGAAIQWGLPWLETVRHSRPGVQRAICVTFAAVIVTLAVAVIALGRRIAGLGRRTAELGQFPPPGLKLLRDVRSITGARAVLVGRGYVVIGWTLVGLALALLGLGSYALVLVWPR